jgi:hypothetical protein
MIPILGISIWTIIKVFALVAFLLYIIFALVVVRQVQLMTDTLELEFEFPVRMLSYLHLGFAVVVFALALLIL